MKQQQPCYVLHYCVAFVFVAAPALAQGGNPPPEFAVRQAAVARLQILQSVIVDYDVEHIHFPRTVPSKSGVANAGITVRGAAGADFSRNRDWYLRGSARWEWRMSADTIATQQKTVLAMVETVMTYSSGGLLEQMNVRTDRALGSIEPRLLAPQLFAMDLGLGLRESETGGWLTSEALLNMNIAYDKSGNVLLQRKNARDQLLEFVLDPNNGYAMTGYRRYDNEAPYSVLVDVAASDFRVVQGIPLPFLVVRRIIHTDGYVADRWQAKVRQYLINDPQNNSDQYHIGWRKGMTVIDRRTGNVFKITQDGQKLTDEVISDATHGGGRAAKMPTTLPAGPILVDWLTPLPDRASPARNSNSDSSTLFVIAMSLGCAGVIAYGVRRFSNSRRAKTA